MNAFKQLTITSTFLVHGWKLKPAPVVLTRSNSTWPWLLTIRLPPLRYGDRNTRYLATVATLVRHKRYPKIILGQLKIMKLENEELFKQLFTPELVTLGNLFKKYGYEIRMAGGAVRDLIMNKKPEDIDFATTATPPQMKEMFEKESIRMINMNGEKHGTITPRINDKENFEVTTLRVDVVTDGRHAEVKFTTDWEVDAGRRDLTINSMFLDLEGQVYDYHNGIEDLKNYRVRFVGVPEDRIQEDYLRILRYFRFYGRIAKSPDDHEEMILKAIKDNVSGLGQISGERLWVEFRKILSGPYGGLLTLKMLELGIGSQIGLPEDSDINEFATVMTRLEQTGLKFNPITLLTALLRNQNDVQRLHQRLKLSAFERDLSYFIVFHRGEQPHEIPIRPYQKLYLFSKSRSDQVKQWILEVLTYNGQPDLVREFDEWLPPKFPINGHMMREAGVPPKLISQVQLKLKEEWVDSDFTLTVEELTTKIKEILAQL